MRSAILLHSLLLLLASTDFTIATSVIDVGPFRWCYLKYASQTGFGQNYVSAYTLPVVLTYVAAFSVGVAAFMFALKRGRPVVGTLGLICSALGLASFLIEGSHWVFEHRSSWLAFSPATMFALASLTFLPTVAPATAAPP